MGLPEGLNIIGLELQDQEILLSNHRPVLLSFYTFSLATPSNHRWSTQNKAGCISYGYPIATGLLGGKSTWETWE